MFPDDFDLSGKQAEKVCKKKNRKRRKKERENQKRADRNIGWEIWDRKSKKLKERE